MGNKPRQSVTLKDLAAVTGYSVNTVSRALRGKDDIAADTRDKIKAAAAQMGYVNNAMAASLRSGRSNIIAVILGDVSNPHFSIMTREIEKRAAAHGYNAFLLNTNEDETQEQEAIQSAVNKNVDGILICPSQHSPRNLGLLMDYGLPFVQIGRYTPGLPASYVVCNDELGGYQATKYLLDKGHRRVAMLGGPAYISSAAERLAGYHRAHREAGVPVQEELVRQVPVTAGGAAHTVDVLLDENPGFSAIFAFSDMIAWEAWAQLVRRGCQVPKDYSLVGFDNIQSRIAIPHRLSTISTQKATMAETAVDCLVGKMKGVPLPEGCAAVCRHVIPTRLVAGETVLPFPAGG